MSERLNDLLFDGEQLHTDSDKALVIAGVAGFLFGTIRPGAPVEHILIKAVLGSLAAIVAIRIHPGAEQTARAWRRYQREQGDEESGRR